MVAFLIPALAGNSRWSPVQIRSSSISFLDFSFLGSSQTLWICGGLIPLFLLSSSNNAPDETICCGLRRKRKESKRKVVMQLCDTTDSDSWAEEATTHTSLCYSLYLVKEKSGASHGKFRASIICWIALLAPWSSFSFDPCSVSRFNLAINKHTLQGPGQTFAETFNPSQYVRNFEKYCLNLNKFTDCVIPVTQTRFFMVLQFSMQLCTSNQRQPWQETHCIYSSQCWVFF